MLILRSLFTTVLVLAVAQTANAQQFWTFQAIVNVAPQVSGIAVGDTILVSVEYDPNATDSNIADPALGSYSPATATVSIVTSTGTHVGSAVVPSSVLILNNSSGLSGSPIDGITLSFPENLPAPAIEAINFPSLGETFGVLIFLESGPTLFSSDAFPTSTPAFSSFDLLSGVILFPEPLFAGAPPSHQAPMIAFGDSGTTQQTPILPTSMTTNPNGSITYTFPGGISFCVIGCWIDPPITDQYLYEIVGSGLFTSIEDFPTGFSQPFDVRVGEIDLGTFGPGQSVDFSGFPGGGVTSFIVSGIEPGVDAASPVAFPLQIAVDSVDTLFQMTSAAGATPVSASSLGGRLAVVLLLAVCGAAALQIQARRRQVRC